MKRRWLILTGALLLSICLQSTFFARFNLFGVAPDLVLVIVVSHALLYGPISGSLWGLVGGLFLDLASGGILGINILLKTALGFGIGLFERTVFKDNLLVPTILVVFATLANETISYLILTALGWRGQLGSYFIFTVIPLLLQHMILTFPVYYLLLKGLRLREESFERRMGI